jgi:hypothetical protein
VDPEQLVEELLLSQLSEYRQRQILLGQVALANDLRNQKWLSDVAGFCYKMGFGYASDGWIERHIGTIPQWAYSHTGRPKPKDLAAETIPASSSDGEWSVVTRKRKFSTIRWEEKKVRYGEGCWNCGSGVIMVGTEISRVLLLLTREQPLLRVEKSNQCRPRNDKPSRRSSLRRSSPLLLARVLEDLKKGHMPLLLARV